MNSDLTRARAYYYEFFAIPLFFSDDDEMFNKWRKQLLALEKFVIIEEDFEHFQALKEFDFTDFKKEQNSVLYDFSFTNVPLTASFYDEGRDDGKARRLVLESLRKSTYRRNEQVCKDNEDFIGFIFYTMSTFLLEEVNSNNFLSTELFVNVINQIIDEFIFLLSNQEASNFFKHLSALMATFFATERSTLAVAKPIEDRHIARDALKQIPDDSKFNNLNKKYKFDKNI